MHNVYYICDENDTILEQFTNKAKAKASLKDKIRMHREYNVEALAVYENAYIMQTME